MWFRNPLLSDNLAKKRGFLLVLEEIQSWEVGSQL